MPDDMSNAELIGHMQGLGAKMDGMQALMQQEMHAMNGHLKTLNGKVARNVSDIGELKMSEAKRDGAKEAMAEFNSFRWKVATGVSISFLVAVGGAIYAVISS